jgi:NADH:ubiquinone oxidoreductase subunit 4 (subunit M)
MLRLFQGVMNGPDVPDLPERRDMTWLEGLAVAPLVVAVLLLGIDPKPVIALTAAAQTLGPVNVSAR